jgi:hypothetical protein
VLHRDRRYLHGMRATILAVVFVSLAGCKSTPECIEACGKAHHDAVTKCAGDEQAKAACEAKVDEAHASCEAACKKE